MLYFLYFLVVGTVLIVCKILYNIMPMLGMCVTAIAVCYLGWVFFFRKAETRYSGMDPNRSIKDQEEERMKKYLEEANKAPEEREGKG